jgi:hypothetical protein
MLNVFESVERGVGSLPHSFDNFRAHDMADNDQQRSQQSANDQQGGDKKLCA